MSAVANPLRVAPARAWSLRRGAGIDGLQLRARASGQPQGSEVLVRMRAVGLNYRELMVARGEAGAPDRDIVPASDGAGEVIAIGPEVRGLRVGDRVISSFFPDWIAGPATAANSARGLGGGRDGVLAEHVMLPESAWVHMPAHMSFVEASTLSCAGVVAWHALFCAEPLPPDAAVAVLGSGGVSLWALQLAKAAGHRAFATSSDDGKCERLLALGADAVVNYRREPQWGEALQRLSGGGVDRVIDVGGPDTLAQSLQALRVGGSVAIVGRLGGSEPARFDPAELFGGSKRLLGVLVGSRAMTDELARFTERKQLRPLIDRVFGFEEAPAAFRYLAEAGQVGKVVIELGGD